MLNRHPVRSLVCAVLLAAARLQGEQWNGWPLLVQETKPDGQVVSAQAFGPLLFGQYAQGEVSGFRPLVLRAQVDQKQFSTLLYPLFTWQEEPGYSEFSFFKLINRRRGETAGKPSTAGFDVWPFYFSRQTGDPATSYRALFPVAGTIHERFGKDRLTWYGFPLYLNSEKAGMQVTAAPWPFLRFIEGAGHHGFEFWPLFGHRGRAGDYDQQFYLWPLIYKSSTGLSDPVPQTSLGFLPFYSSDTGPGLRRENYLWPFLGYTHRTAPYRYDEQRYFWPLLVQGRGDQRVVNRWAPVYTHSVIKGYDKTWVLWPLFRHAAWAEQGVAQEKDQVFFFLYWSLTQRSLTNPAAAPARKSHVWPLYSAWDNGAGRQQVQVLSPLEVFFPTNDIIRQLYTPLFALYRYDRQGDQAVRHSLLWNAISYRREGAAREFHLGPLLGINSGADHRRIALGLGLIGWRREPGEAHGRFFLFDFRRKPATKTTEASSP